MCLNLCSCKWLSPTRNLVSSLIPWLLCTLNILGLINLTDSNFRILLLSLFHSITVDWKKEFWKYSFLTLNKGLLLWLLVVPVDKTLGNIKEVRVMFIYLFIYLFICVWKTSTIFGTIVVILATQDLIFDKAFLLRNTWYLL